MEDISAEIRKKAHLVCSEYLEGEWRRITKKELIIEKLSGGYANLTLKLSLPEACSPIKGEPTQVIMKIHLGALGEGYFRQITENVIAIILAEKKLAPRVYGIFDGGRLDEYVISRPLTYKDLQNPNIIGAIARKLAHLHSLTLPINKDPNKMYNLLNNFLDKALNDPRNKHDDPKRKILMENLMSTNPHEEIKWLKEIINSIQSPVVYCHGDMQPNNILLRENSPDDPVHIIDLDLSGYNYRGIDFASLTSSFCFEIPYPDPPYYKTHWDLYPTIEEQKFIIFNYLEEFQKLKNKTLDFEKELQLILKETKVFTMFLSYFSYIFIVGKKDDPLAIKMDWSQGAAELFNRYKKRKQEFILEN